MSGFRHDIARAMTGTGPEQRKVAFAFLERTAALVDLDSRELTHRVADQLGTAISRAEPALIAPAAMSLNSESINRDIIDVVKELEERVGRDFGRPHWYEEDRDIIG